MAIEINGKIYRNLQEQVLKNKEDIEELKAATPVIPDTPDVPEGVTEERVNELIDAAAIKRDGSTAPTGDISWNDKGLVELGFIELDEQVLRPTTETDIWKDSASNIHVTCPIVADFGLNSGGLPITNVGTPSNNTDAATKAYVDSAVAASGGGGSSETPSLPTLNGYSESIYCAAGNYNGGNVQEDHNYANWDWSVNNTGYFAEVGNLIFVQITNTNPPPVEGIQVSSFANRGVNYALLWGMVGQTVTVYTNNVTTNGIFAVPHTQLDEQLLLCFSKVV